jgi:hypothetical protein
MHCKIKFTAILLSLITTGVSAQIRLSGTIVDSHTKEPLEFANIVLLKADSSFVDGTSCDSVGFFAFGNLSKGDYVLSTTFIGYDKTYTPITSLEKDRDLGTISLQSSDIALKEVTVTGAGVIQKVDRQLLIPSATQIKASNNGLTLLRNMQLSRIEINPLFNTITTSGGDAVQLRINGIEVTMAEVIALQPQEIIRIEYHDNPGMRYGNVAAVIDYIIRRRDSGGSISANLANAFWRLGFAEDYLSAKMNHKKSEFGVNAYYDYRNIEWIRENRQTFVFPDRVLHQDEIGNPTKAEQKILNLVLNYNLCEPDKYLFSAIFRNNNENSPHQFTDRNSTLYTYSSGDSIQSSISDHSTWRNNTPSLDLYFQRNLKRDQLIILDAVGTYMDSKSTRLYQQTDPLYTSYSCITGKKYSLITEGVYEKKWKTAMLTAGLKHSQSYTGNDYTGNVTDNVGLVIAETYGYAEYQLQQKKFNYTFGLGATRMFTSQGGSRLEKYIFRPRLRVGYAINKSADVRYNGYISSYPPSLSDMNNVTQNIDALQVQQGNPNLQTAWYCNNEITGEYNKGIFGVDLYAQHFYVHKPAMEQTTFDDSVFVHTVINQGAYHHLYGLLAMKLKPWKNYITLSVTPTFDRYIMTGNNYVHTYNNWSVRASLLAIYKKWVFNIDLKTRRNDFYGETLNIAEKMITLAAGYNTPKWSAGVMVANPFTNEYSQGTANYSALTAYNSTAYTHNMGQVIAFNFRLNLSFGRKYNAAAKRVDNKDTDAGIMTGAKK